MRGLLLYGVADQSAQNRESGDRTLAADLRADEAAGSRAHTDADDARRFGIDHDLFRVHDLDELIVLQAAQFLRRINVGFIYGGAARHHD